MERTVMPRPLVSSPEAVRGDKGGSVEAATAAEAGSTVAAVIMTKATPVSHRNSTNTFINISSRSGRSNRGITILSSNNGKHSHHQS